MKIEERARWRAQEESLILFKEESLILSSGSDQAIENRVWASGDETWSWFDVTPVPPV